MSAPGPTLRGARLAAVLAGVAVAASVLFAGPASASPPGSPDTSTTTLRATQKGGITASITPENRGVLGPGQDLVIAITVTNTGESTVTSGSAAAWLDPDAQTSRTELDGWLTSTETVSDRIPLGTVTLPPLEPGTSSVVRVTVPAGSVPFGKNPRAEVFGIGAVIDTVTADATARGSVVWSPGVAATRADVGVVMPIVSPATSDGLISAEDLATYTGANGVLTRDLDGLRNHSTITIGIDPMILASIRVLGNAAPASAIAWLDQLSALPNDTFSLSYGDADLTGQLQAGLPGPIGPTALSHALDPSNFTPTPTTISEQSTTTPAATGTPTPSPTPGAGPVLPTLDELLAWDYTLDGIAWPGDKTVRSEDLQPLASAGLRTVIVSGDNTNADELEETPNAPIRSGNSTLAVADETLSDALRQAVSAPSDVAWNTAMARLNAQLELLSAEDGPARHVLLALDRSWPSSGTQLDRTLESLYTSPWTTPSTLSSLLTAKQTHSHALVDSPESPSRIDGIQSLLEGEKALGDFATVLADPTRLTGRARAQLLTLLAVSWQNPRTDWEGAVSKFHEATTKMLHSITILPTENINLVSAQGSIPFTVSNGLSGEQATVVLSASPSNGRLEIDESTTKTIPQNSRATMLVPVKAKVGNGEVVLTLQLYSPTGVPIGDPTAVVVDVHADWEGIGALIFGVLLVLLFGFGIVRNILRRRSQRRRRAEGGDTEPGVADDDADAAPTAVNDAASTDPTPPEKRSDG